MRNRLCVLDHSKTFQGIRDLSDQEVREVQLAVGALRDFWDDYHLFTVVLWNFDEFRDMVMLHPDVYVRASWQRPIGSLMVLDLNRRLVNLLSTMRMFLDHMETALKRRYGPNSPKVVQFSQAAHKEYDNSFAYRFMYALRNYTQHCGMPMGRVQVHAEAIGTQDNLGARYAVSFEFDRDGLLSKHQDWKPRIKLELSEKPAYFAVPPLVDELIACLHRIAVTAAQQQLDAIQPYIRFIDGLLEPTRNLPGAPCILNIAPEPGSDDHFNFTPWFLPVEMLQLVHDFQELS